MLVATHSGPFHADDVFACSMLRVFLNDSLEIVRTRDLQVIAKADIAIDVGGKYDIKNRRFDHHQREYEGELSSAGMVLNWLEESGRLTPILAARLRENWVDYIDAVDNGKRKPEAGVPTIGAIVGSIGERAETLEEFDELYLEAVRMCESAIHGVAAGIKKSETSKQVVLAAMKRAEEVGSRVLDLDKHYKWKRAYFENGGSTHPTDYVLFPDGSSWRIIAIPPERESFDKKRPFPESWAGLVDAELSEVVGVPGAKFCHKNLFIAVFETEEAARKAIEKWGLATGETVTR